LNIIMTSRGPLNLAAIKRLSGLHPTHLTVILADLIDQGVLAKKSQNGTQIYQHVRKGRPNLSRYAIQLDVRKKELHKIQLYAEQSKKCLMLMLCQALGDNGKNKCDKCNVCTNTHFTSINNKDT